MINVNVPILSSSDDYCPIEINILGVVKESDLFEYTIHLIETVTNSYDKSLLEATLVETKNRIIASLQKLFEIIKNLSEKFKNYVIQLVNSNAKWIAELKTNLNEESISDKFKYNMYPYWKNKDKLLAYRFPEYMDSNTELIEDLKDETAFKEKYFKDLFVTIDGKQSFDPKAFFRGAPNKITIGKKELIPQLNNMISYLEKYKELTKNIIDRNNKILDLLNKTINKAKAAPMNETNMILETVCLLLEQEEGPTTSNKIDDKSSNTDAVDDKNKDTKNNEPGMKDAIDSQQIYNRIIYPINSARMIISEETYDEYAKCLHAAYRTRKK